MKDFISMDMIPKVMISPHDEEYVFMKDIILSPACIYPK
jgi:hypothetical protein